MLAVRRRVPQGRWWWRSAVLGVLNIGGFFALLFVAAFRLPGGVAATAGAVQPLIAAGLAAALVGERFRRTDVVCGALGMLGVSMLVLQPGAELDVIGVVAALGGTVSMALGVVLTKRWERPVDLMTFTAWQLVAGGLFLLPILITSEGLPSSVSAANVAGFAWLSIFGTALAYANWFRGIQELSVATISVLVLISPLVATALGWAVLGQQLRSVQAAGALLVVAAVVTPQVARSPAGDRSSEPTPHS
jgi:probable blue pigment (indigoidine) exporter